MYLSCICLAAIAIQVPTCMAGDSANRPLVSSPGSSAIIPSWFLQSTASASKDLSSLSNPGADVSTWYNISSHATVMAGLIENNVYNTTTLFFSNTMEDIDVSPFNVPWLYRQEFTLSPQKDQHFFLQTNGITSKGDIYLNGKVLATKDTQKGAYGGLKYDITEFVKTGKNVILITAYPTNYLADFALGYVDWNPYPADNGMGVWRDVSVLQTGPVSMLKPRVITDYAGKPTALVTATVHVVVQNNSPSPISGTISGSIQESSGGIPFPLFASYSLKSGENKTITLNTLILNPQIWWPKHWGEQPLYNLDLAAYVGFSLSDQTKRTFGIRHVTSALNEYNNTAFTVNGHLFQVAGGGYSTDLFLRLDEDKLTAQIAYVLDMGMNAIRLEGKQEQPLLYDLADQMGLMIMPGWECCDKWEGWTYNDEADGVLWDDADYDTAGKQMYHEATMMQGHPSVLAFLVGSDFWPDERAAPIYVNTLKGLDWDVPIIASAAMRGHPSILPPSGLKMDGPYDWNAPVTWYGDQLGAAFGFGSELGSGVGTPELSSLKKFLSEADLNDLWTAPDKGLYHMSTNVSQFYDRSIYNTALYARYGAPTSLDDYLIKAQISDYEATRVQYEAYSVRQNAENPATGLIYWMLNNAWPSLHWNLFDYYLKAAGSYFGAKCGYRLEHVAYEYGSQNGDVWIINHTIDKTDSRSVSIDLIDLDGKTIVSKTVHANTQPTTSLRVASVPETTSLKDVAFLRLVLKDGQGSVLSRNVYWLSTTNDVPDWDDSTWYNTPTSSYANYKSLFSLGQAQITVTQHGSLLYGANGAITAQLSLSNKAKIPAFFIRLELQSANGADVTPALWDDNYITLWPEETLTLGVQWNIKSEFSPNSGTVVKISGVNIGQAGPVNLK